MTLPTLQQLRYLVAVADHLHFGRAAQECAVTQSALSSGLQELERLLDVTLVDRTKRRVALTPAGEDIARRAREVLVRAQDLVEAARSASKPLSTEIRLGVLPTIGPYLLPRVLARLREAHPDLRVYLREEQTEMLLEGVRSGRLDAAWIALPYDTGELVVRELGWDAMWVAVPPDHPLARAEAVDAQDLGDAPLLLLEDGHCLREHALEACHRRAGANEVFQATSLRTLVEMVAGRLGLTLLPGVAVASETGGRSDVVARPLRERSGRCLALVWRPRAAREPEYELLAEVVEPVVREMAGAG